MRLVHDPADGDARTLASDVETADTFASRLFGLMFRSAVPEGYALVFPFDGAKRRGIHTVFVRVPIDVVWVADERVTRVETLAPWRSVARAEADTVIELASGGADGVNAGDAVRIVD
ncbi:DUF192 domain-containing protein [Halostella sp. JP-L12]|uniref:DUF192 domain-containing protein n=1 Tax=Halostella TaxID=1843185 RepID=UPI000EF813DC|nr:MULTISPECIES: DUF192 domain-containing protein [Halostella]NHN47752.1 DUF192 domain-containing protein [Halostella sp. JP-L12]